MSNVRRDWLAAAALACVTFATFLPALRCGFINYDDPFYVTNNPLVLNGLCVAGVREAFTTFTQANWHPLTWLSLQLDASLWRKSDGTLDPRGFHLTNVLLHAANAALLFGALRVLTGCFWRSAVVALLFAVHPQRVESVAWVTERKDVLSMFFGLLALLAYALYARRPSAGRYATVMAAYALSLMAKAMLVTLPCLLLVLDWWPLRRWLGPPAGPPVSSDAPDVTEAIPSSGPGRGRPRRLVLEKLPLFALAVVACVITYRAQLGGGVRDWEKFPLDVRVENAAIAYVAYPVQMVWPVGLAPLYPHRGRGIPPAVAAGAALLIVAVTFVAVIVRRRAPYLLTGWLWYLGTLVPVIGLLQVGIQSYADRYSYFPQVGLLLAVCWGVADLCRAWPRTALAAAATAAVALAAVTRQQIPYWNDSLTLWTHDIEVTWEHPLALNNLGTAFEERNNLTEAADCYAKAVRILPTYDTPLFHLATVLQKLGRNAEATEQFEKYCRLLPRSPWAHDYLGRALFNQGNLAAAREHHMEAIHLDPNLASAHYNLGMVEVSLNHFPAAVACFEKALSLSPKSADARCGLGIALLQLNQVDDSIVQLREATRSDPVNGQAHLWLGKALTVRGDLDEAAPQLEEAARIDPKMALIRYDLGGVYSRQGRLKDAADSYLRAIELEPASEDFRKALATVLEALTKSGQGETARQMEQRLRRVPSSPAGASTPVNNS
jgi:tetratricopeptide (TPR) repeat protein